MTLTIEVTGSGEVQLRLEDHPSLNPPNSALIIDQLCAERAESIGHMIIAAAENARLVRNTRDELRLEALCRDREAIEVEIKHLAGCINDEVFDDTFGGSEK